jgi:hypothetical protein
MRLVIALALSLTACATTQAPPTTNWRAVATEDDRQRLRDWRDAFTEALAQAHAAGHSADLEREGTLLVADAALGGEKIPNGDYRCRVIKLGSMSEGMPGYIAYPAFRCRVSQQGELQHFDKLGGSQRHHGTIYPGDNLRQTLLGTLVLGDETRAYQYGRDLERDLAGWIERIGDKKWRLVLPYPHYESKLDIVELSPEP